MKDFVLIVDDFLTHEECDNYINILENEIHATEGPPLNYSLHSLVFHDNSKLENEIVNHYKKRFPEIDMTPSHWAFDTSFMIKKFIPGKAFDVWHCEQSYTKPQRIACAIIYLSDHNCGTEFYDGSVVLSKKGRLMVFPTFWTHMHRGQVCPDNKDRYIISGYISYIRSPV